MPCAKRHFAINKTLAADRGIFYAHLIVAFSVFILTSGQLYFKNE